MSSSSKKITYTSDFKLKVLDYYFKNGGDDNFGLKKKTAIHFNVDKKTVNRMLNNPDMVKRAQKLLSKRLAMQTSRAQSKVVPSPERTPTKGGKAGGGKLGATGGGKNSSKSGSSTASSKSGNAAGVGSGTLKGSTSSSISTNKPGGSGVGSTKLSGGPSSSKSAVSKTKHVNRDGKRSVPVFDLPEDPDYSLLNPSIAASSNSVANIAKALFTGTEEVRKMLLNECDMILECRVCRNLFRSLVNFLAHKRIYCQDEHAGVRSLFHKDPVQGLTSQSHTVIVEPETPPPNWTPPPHLTPKAPHTSLSHPPKPGGSGRRGIDSIAEKLAGNKTLSHPSDPSHTGSSEYYAKVEEVNTERDLLSRECTVVLEDIAGVTTARYQTFQPPSLASSTTTTTTVTTTTPISAMLSQVAAHSAGVTVAIDECGDVVQEARGDVTTMTLHHHNTKPPPLHTTHHLLCHHCNTRFATQKTLSVHQRSHHGLERCVYICPICRSSFLSMWAVIKHLQKIHRKTKNQIERLRKVIRKNVYKKMVFQSEGMGVDKEEEEEEQEEEDEMIEEDISTNSKLEVLKEEKDKEVVSRKQKSPYKSSQKVPSPRKLSLPPAKFPAKTEDPGSSSFPEHRCIKCERRFQTAAALISHKKFCSLRQMKPDILLENPLNSRLRSETPEKKIAIQIRKDYKKTMNSNNLPNNHCNDDPQSEFKVPDIPGIPKDPEETLENLEEMMRQICNIKILKCIPCDKRYQTITALKRHACVHFGFTRYVCCLCQFRSYHRYECIRHGVNNHKATEESVMDLVMENHKTGSFRYHLASEEEPSLDLDFQEEEAANHQHAPKQLSEPSDVITAFQPDNRSASSSKDKVIEHNDPSILVQKYPEMSNTKENSTELCTESLAKEIENGDVDKVNNDKEQEVKSSVNVEDNVIYTSKITSNESESCVSDMTNKINNPKSGADCSLQAIDSVTETELSDNPILSTDTIEKTQVDNEIVKQYPLRGYVDSSATTSQSCDDADEERSERPQRLRRSVEQKDFIYEGKGTGFLKSEKEDGKYSTSPNVKRGHKPKAADKVVVRRKISYPKTDSPSKRVKTNDLESKYESCNGNSQSASPKKGKNSMMTSAEGKNFLITPMEGKSNDVWQRVQQVDKNPAKMLPGRRSEASSPRKLVSQNGSTQSQQALCTTNNDLENESVNCPLTVVSNNGKSDSQTANNVQLAEVKEISENMLKNGKLEMIEATTKEREDSAELDNCEHLPWEKGKGDQSQDLCSEDPTPVTENLGVITTISTDTSKL